MSTPTNDPQPRTQPAPNLYLAPTRGAQLDGRLGWLVRIYGLDIYGDSLLTRPAVNYMKTASIVLTVILLFDLFAWTLLWNATFHGGLLKVDLMTALAFATGALFAITTIIWEQQFFTADMSGGLKRVKWAVLLRAVIIVVAALITSQPFELLIFDGSIQDRIHEEGVRAEAGTRLSELASIKEDESLKSAEHQLKIKNYNDAKGNAQKSEEEYQKTQASLKLKREALGRANASVQANQAAARRAGNDRLRAIYQQRARGAQATADRISGEIRGLETDAEVSRQREQKASTRLTEDEGKVQEILDRAALGKKRLRVWAEKIQKAEPGGDVVTEDPDFVPQGKTAWTYSDPPYNFFQRLRILEDLKAGTPARWKVNGPDRRELINFYKIKDNNPDEAEAAETARLAALSENPNLDSAGLEKAAAQGAKEARAAAQRLNEEAALFRFAYRAWFGLAMFIPVMVLGMKLFLLSPALKDYYSADVQRKGGNYEALIFTKDENGAQVTTLKGSAPTSG